MKRFNLLVLTALTMIGQAAHATSPIRFEYARMDHVDFDAKSGFATSSDVVLTIDHAQNQIELDVTLPVPSCDLSKGCLPVMPVTQKIAFSIEEVTTSCGSRAYRAVKTPEALGSPYQELVVQDNSRRRCHDDRPAVEVTYTKMRPRSTVQSVSEMSSVLPLSSSIDSISSELIERSQLDEINVDRKLIDSDVSRADVKLDMARGVVSLNLVHSVCPMNAMCKVPFLSKRFELSVVSQKKNACGSIITVAREDQRPVDGLLEEIVVQDNRTRQCKDFRPGVEVLLKTEGGRFPVKTRSTFSGPALD